MKDTVFSANLGRDITAEYKFHGTFYEFKSFHDAKGLLSWISEPSVLEIELKIDKARWERGDSHKYRHIE